MLDDLYGLEGDPQGGAVTPSPVVRRRRRVAAPQPAEEQELLSWSDYQQARSGVDPADAYNEYVTIYAPSRVAAMGATPEQVEQFVTGFKRVQPPPARQPKDEGLLKNIGKAVGSEFGMLGRTIDAGRLMTGAGDIENLAELEKEQRQEVAASPSQARFRKSVEGAKWHDLLGRLAKAAGQEPEGAFESTLQLLVGFLPYVAAGTVGSLGGPVGMAAAFGLTGAEMRLGSEGLLVLGKAVREAGIDINDTVAVKKWLKEGGFEQVFGKSIGPALTEGAVNAVAMGVAGKLGNTVAQTLSRSGLVDDATRGAIMAGREGVREGSATAGSLRSQARGLKAAELGTGAVGFGAAPGVADLVAGREPDDAGMFGNVVLMLVTGVMHARRPFTALDKKNLPEIKPKETKQGEQKKEEVKSPAEELTEERLRALAGEARVEESALKPEDDVFKQILKPEDDVFKNPPKTFDELIAEEKASVKPERPTEAEIEAIQPFEAEATAVSTAQQAMKEVQREHIEEVAAEVKAEVEERKATRATTATTVKKGLKRPAASGPVETPELRTGAVEEAVSGPGSDPRYSIVEERVRTRVEGQPQRNQPTGSISGSGKEAAAGTGVSGERKPGKKPTLKKDVRPRWAREIDIAAGDTFVLDVPIGYASVGTHTVRSIGPELVSIGGTSVKGNALRAEIAAGNARIDRSTRKQSEAEKNKLKLPKEEEFQADPLSDFEAGNLGIKKDVDYAPPTWSVDTSTPDGVRLRPSFPPSVETVVRSGRATGEKLLEWFATKSDVPDYRALAQDMLPQMRGKNIPINIVDKLIGPDGKSKRGFADSDKNVIGLDKKFGVDQETLFHELTHILTVNAVENPRTLSQRAAAGEMKRLYEFVKAQTRPELFKPMLRNVKEFIAEAHANPNFQDHLVDISNALKSGRNAWQVFKDLVRRLVFWRRPVDENVLEQVLRVSKDLYDVREGRGVDYAEGVKKDKPYVTYDVVDSQTGKVVGSYTNKTRARNEVDKRDNEYGGVRYRRNERIVYPEDYVGPRDTGSGGLLSAEALAQIGLKRKIGGFEKTEVDYAEGDAQTKQLTAEVQKHGRGDVVGRTDGVDAFRAWKQDDGTYRVYRVSEQEPAGEKASKQILANEEAVREFMEGRGAEVELRNKQGFDQAPGNTEDLITRWVGGKLAYTAVKDEQGKWHSQTSEDLQTRTAERKRATYETEAEARAAADKVSIHEGKQASETARDVKGLKDLTGNRLGDEAKIVVGEPGWTMKSLMNKNAAITYTGGALDGWMKDINKKAPEGMNLSVEYQLRNSDTARITQRMLKEEAEQLINDMRGIMKRSSWFSSGDVYEKVDRTLSATHAVERMAKKLPTYKDETKWVDPNNHALGYTEYYKKVEKNLDDAQKYLAEIKNQDSTVLDELKPFMRDLKRFTDKTIDVEVESGRMDPITGARIKRAYETYVPLVEGGKARKKTATGQSAFGDDVISRIIEQRADAIMRGVDNKAMRLMMKWARVVDFRNPDGTKLFRIEPVDREHVRFNPETGLTEVTSVINAKNSVVYWEDGKPIRVEVNNPELQKLLDPFKGEERDSVIKKMLGAVGFYTRMFSVLHTSLAPAFGPRNFVRDYGTNAYQLDPRISYPKFHKAMISGDVWGAAFRHGFKEAASLLGKDTINSGNTDGAHLARLVDQYRPLIERPSLYGAENIANEYRTSLKPSVRSKAEKLMAPTDGQLMNFLSGVAHSLEGVNRIAVFKAARESGIGDREAAAMAKESTVNFEQRGSLVAPRALFAFSSAKMSGARTFGKNLGFTQIEGPQRGGVKQGLKGLLPGTEKPKSANPRTIKAAQMMLALGLASAFANYKTSSKEDDGRTKHGKRSDFQLDNYFFIPGTDFAIPLPQEVALFYIAGNSMGDVLWGDRAGSTSPAYIRFATAVINNFWPGGTSMHDPLEGKTTDYVARLMMPTPAVALWDIGANMDTFGRPVNSLKGSKTIPAEFQGAERASLPANLLAQGIAKTGIMETSPLEVDHVLKDLFQQQKGSFNAITQGNVGALLKEPVKSFHQEVFPGATKNDFDAVAKRVATGAYRTKGGPLKKGERDALFQEFVDTQNKLKKLGKQWGEATDKDVKEKISAEQNAIRLKTLRKYYEATGLVKP